MNDVDCQMKKMSFDEMLSLFQEILHDVLGPMFKPEQVTLTSLLSLLITPHCKR